ncbi:hypothetical protein TNCV_1945111 [Trichonephila clavipes]|nr:hypothetical protein TNCV_1945111 [Trichonephila clavipes]
MNSCAGHSEHVIKRTNSILTTAGEALMDVPMGASGTLNCGRIDHRSWEQPEHNCDLVAAIYGTYLSKWIWPLLEEQRRMSHSSE